MDDLIDRDAVLHDISTECSNAYEAKYYEAQVALTRAKRIICDAPPVNRWIPCKSYLPEQEDIVWVCLYWGKDAYVKKGYIKNGVWYTADGFRMIITPKFWMPEYIPEPPKGEHK